jgi:hypothetical protein
MTTGRARQRGRAGRVVAELVDPEIGRVLRKQTESLQRRERAVGDRFTG